ncbi:MAG TPA: thioredoxin [Ktedonobacterales bacterium]|nr:thioredoxin [Ktedonobacterales bacterium]
MSDAITHVTDANFADTVLKSDKPAVVDFWAPWCRPCLMMAPILEEFAKQYQDKMLFTKLNTDDNQMTAGRFGIQGIPTLLFFRNGREVDRVVGLESRDVLRRHIEAAIAAAAV